MFPYLFLSFFLLKSGGELMVGTWKFAAFIGLEVFCAYGKQVMCFKLAMSAVIKVKCFIEGRVKFLAP